MLEKEEIRDLFRKAFFEEKGKLIVMTGPDGCGKTTQTKLLVERLKQQSFIVETIDFPQYENNFFGRMVGRYMAGEFGDPTKVSPYLASMLYAGDRWQSVRQIDQWLEDNKIVVCDRYIGDNFLHQGSKIPDSVKREEFFQWLYDLEFIVFSAQSADMTLYLDVSLEISLKLLEEKDAKEKKDYTGGKKDGHENEKHLRGVRKINEELIEKYSWTKINCMKGEKLMSPEEVSGVVWETLNSKLRPF